MAINKKKEAETVDINIQITRVKQFESGDISFDAVVNGIKLYGMTYKSGTSKNGKEYTLISMPSKKGNDNNYYNHYYFPVSDDLMKNIEKQIESLL